MTLLDQLCVRIRGAIAFLYICVSYIQPLSNDSIYKPHVNNVLALLNVTGDNQLCVLGDFNLSNISWQYLDNNVFLTPSNINTPTESYFIDNLLDMGLTQINDITNGMSRFLDLIFISDDSRFDVSQPASSISPVNLHHIPLVLDFESVEFFEVCSETAKTSFNFAACDFKILEIALREIDWNIPFGNNDVAECFKMFKTLVLDLCFRHVPVFTIRNYKNPWYTKDLKFLKNLKNEFFKKLKSAKEVRFYDLYISHRNKSRDLNKSLFNKYIQNFEVNIKTNPKNFWRYIKSMKKASGIPNSVLYNDVTASCLQDAANLFADFFASNFVSDVDLPVDDLAAVRRNLSRNLFTSIDFG
ncbi:uncharacterized protein LOC118749078 [Rhagoletis pomonella]|uniref:uncharacterized protein LOC118749078 n=1 Tax=Rhagoletis pomonella TaxID=28610 RepID=UPI001784333C|nr:uncharacterized protein LOC118749078 [Rhagoletis pomonella]